MASSVKVKVEDTEDSDVFLVSSRTSNPPLTIKKEAENLLIPTASGAAPKKRVRYFVEAVEILVPKREVDRKMIKWRNPKVKKDGNMMFGADTILSRISKAGISLNLFPTGCEKTLQDVMVRRDFMVQTFGGNGRMTFPSISSSRVQEHGYDNFMYICPQWQPIAPEVPGAPGLWLTIDEYSHHGETRRLFTRISRAPALWQYQGQYELRSAEKLTMVEWGKQTEILRNTWAREMCNQNWGIFMRTRIYGRMYFGRLPTKEECSDIASRKLYEKVGKEDVALALTRGEETLAVYTMKCVGYDVQFQREVAEGYAEWDQKRDQADGNKKGKRKKEVDQDGYETDPSPIKRQRTSPSLRDEDGSATDEEP